MSENNVPVEEDSLKTLLKSWNLDHKYNTFKDENITMGVLKILGPEHIQELTSKWKIGEKAIFAHHFRAWKSDVNSTSISKCSSDISACSQNFENTPPQPTTNLSDTNESLNINVMEILKENSIGNKLISTYRQNNHLTEESRGTLIKIIVQYFESTNITMSLQTSYKIEQQILHIFPNEKLEFYRTARRGRIYMKYHNMKKSTKHIFADEDEAPTTSCKLRKLQPEENAEFMVQSLKFDNLSSEEFDITWGACTQYRLNSIINDSTNITDVLKMWPHYKALNGYKLIDKDFGTMYNKYCTIINWCPKFTKLFNFLKSTKSIKAQKDEKVLLDQINILDSEKDADQFALQTLWVLHPFLFPTARHARRTVLGTTEVSRFTIKDSQQSFLFLGKSLQELEDHVDFLKVKRENIQPFLLGVGSLAEISQIFIYFDGTLIPFKSFLRAFDILFKIFHVFHLKYPSASEHFWCFIEHYFYEINTNSKKHGKVSILLEDLTKI